VFTTFCAIEFDRDISLAFNQKVIFDFAGKFNDPVKNIEFALSDV